MPIVDVRTPPLHIPASLLLLPSSPLLSISSFFKERQLTLRQTTNAAIPPVAGSMFGAKAAKGLSFEALAQKLGRSEVAVAAIFYGQAQASPDDIAALSAALGLPHDSLARELSGFPERGRTVDMPRRFPPKVL